MNDLVGRISENWVDEGLAAVAAPGIGALVPSPKSSGRPALFHPVQHVHPHEVLTSALKGLSRRGGIFGDETDTVRLAPLPRPLEIPKPVVSIHRNVTHFEVVHAGGTDRFRNAGDAARHALGAFAHHELSPAEIAQRKAAAASPRRVRP